MSGTLRAGFDIVNQPSANNVSPASNRERAESDKGLPIIQIHRLGRSKRFSGVTHAQMLKYDALRAKF